MTVGTYHMTILPQYHAVSVGHHVDGGHCEAIVVLPMSHDISAGLEVVDPSVPHHLMSVESVLLDAHGIHDTRGTVVLVGASVCLTVAEDDLRTTGVDHRARARPLLIVVVPPANELSDELIIVVVIGSCGLTAVERSVAFLVIRIAPAVPIEAVGLVAAILHHPHRLGVALVDIEHLATVFCFGLVEHLAAADGAPAVGVVGVAQIFHLDHVLPRDALVAALVEENRRVVAVVYNSVAHQLQALHPLTPLGITFGIACRHGLDEAHTVAGLDVLFGRRDMHPPHHIATRLDEQTVGVVAQPGWHRGSYARPLIGGALGIAVHHDHAVVEIDHAALELCLSESGRRDHAVLFLSVSRGEACLHIVEIAVAPRPEVQSRLPVLGAERCCGVSRDERLATCEMAEHGTVALFHRDVDAAAYR